MSRNLTVYFSLLSPWAYIGHAELQGIIAKHGLRVDYRPVALSQVFPESGGLPLAKRHPSRQAYRMLELQRWREKRGLDFHLHPEFWPFDPSLGDRIICAMTLAGADPQKFIAAAFAGTFQRQRNLADPHNSWRNPAGSRRGTALAQTRRKRRGRDALPAQPRFGS